MKLHLDFETRSAVDLKKVGLWAYAMHPSTDVLCLGWSKDDRDVKVLTRADVIKFPRQAVGKPTLFANLFSPYTLCAHNAAFEYAIWNLILHRRYGWPALWEPSRWRCTMAKALACGLPADLDSLGRVLRIKTPKDLDGRKVMVRLCKPRPDGTFDEDPAAFERLYAYNATDVRAEIEVDELMPDLSLAEQKVWEMDLEINRRGVAVDLNLARRGAALSTALVDRLNGQLQEMTGGAVDKATQVTALKYYLADKHGINTESLDKESIVELMTDPLVPEEARRVLSVRRQVGKKTSLAKYQAALDMACPDGRVRGLIQYHAAHTGRFGGRGLQPHNFPKGLGFNEKTKTDEQARAIHDIMASSPDEFAGVYGDRATDTVSDTLRGLFIAGEGKALVCGDFNAIEARVLFWYANEKEALTAYQRGESPYLEMSRAIYPQQGAVPATLTKEFKLTQAYDLGKRSILGDGFGMSWKKFQSTVYTETAKKGKPVLISDALAQRAVAAYRAKYPGVPAFWKETGAAAIAAVETPGRTFACGQGRVLWGMSADRRFLGCRLPSGRFLRYWQPSVSMVWKTWCEDPSCLHVMRDDVMLCPEKRQIKELAYIGENNFTKQWGRVHVYGGLLVENVVQATARDLLVHGMMNVSAAGYQVLLTIHDEVLAEICVGADERRRVEADFLMLLSKTPAWAAGCPVKAEGWMGARYHK